MANAVPIRVPGTGGPTLQYVLPANMMQFVQSVNAVIDNSGGSDTKPVLTVLDSTQEVVADVQQGRVIDGGAQGRATWARRLTDEQEDVSVRVVSGDPNVSVSPTIGTFFRVGRFTLAAQISRDGAAAALTVPSGGLTVTTANIKHNVVTYANGITANIAANPSRLVVQQAGLYLVHASQSWGNFGAADFGLSVGVVVGASPLVNPGMISRRVLNDTLTHEDWRFVVAFPGTVFCQAVGQNSGAPIAMGIGTLTAYRVGPVP